jgi:hypothetical protein
MTPIPGRVSIAGLMGSQRRRVRLPYRAPQRRSRSPRHNLRAAAGVRSGRRAERQPTEQTKPAFAGFCWNEPIAPGPGAIGQRAGPPLKAAARPHPAPRACCGRRAASRVGRPSLPQVAPRSCAGRGRTGCRGLRRASPVRVNPARALCRALRLKAVRLPEALDDRSAVQRANLALAAPVHEGGQVLPGFNRLLPMLDYTRR